MTRSCWVLCFGAFAGLVACGEPFVAMDSQTAGSGASSAGSGGDNTGGQGGVQCRDADMDGYSTCDMDCNDNDPNSFPGQMEICGDGIDNNCDTMIDPNSLCQGVGTFVASEVGSDNNPGTQELPVKTIMKGIANAKLIGNGADVYVAQGQYNEKVIVEKDIDLLGGYQCDMTQCTWDRDSTQYDSAIFNQDLEGMVIGVGVTRGTKVDGFRITGKDGNPGDFQAINTVSIDQGTVTFTNNRVFGAGVTGCNYCGSHAIHVLGPTNDTMGALIGANSITGGPSTAWTTGVAVDSQATAEIVGNTIRGGTGTWTRGIAINGGAFNNIIFANTVQAGGCQNVGTPTTFAIHTSGLVVINDNLINTNPAQVGACPNCNNTHWCGGIESEGGTATITNNVIFGVGAPRSTAVFLGESEIPIGEVILNGNTLDGRGTPNQGISTALAFRTSYPMSTNAVVGRIRNNILIAGAGVNRYSVYEDNSLSPKTCRPQVFAYNTLFGFTVPYRQWNGSSGTDLLTIVQVNSLPNAVANFQGDPMLDATFHLNAASPCIDNGTSEEAPMKDFDGQSRPVGAAVDIGADEAQ